MRLPRMTTRRWMLVVAVAAVTFGAIAIERRRVRFGEIADYHAGRVRRLRSRHNMIRRPDGSYVPRGVPSPRLVNFHTRMANKYRLAASRPRLPVEPDPPEPE
jgi:hypothetical protein